VNSTVAPGRSALKSSDGTDASSFMDEGSMIVKSSVPLLTTSPTLTLRFDTMPRKGARITVSPSARSALASLASRPPQHAPLPTRVDQSEEAPRKNEPLPTLGLLAAEIAHEIRNPLTVIKLLHGPLGADFSLDDPRRRDGRNLARGPTFAHLVRVSRALGAAFWARMGRG
jgi:signal transduction histidine kinase